MSPTVTRRSRLSLAYRTLIAKRYRNTLHEKHVANRDEKYFEKRGQTGIMSFTKGLEHNADGSVKAEDFKALRRAIDDGEIAQFASVPTSASKKRKWEAPTAGFVMDPQGPDAQAITMPPAPALNEKDGTFNELVYELAEVYELALLRDVPFTDFEEGNTNGPVSKATKRLNRLDYGKGRSAFSGRPRKVVKRKLTEGTVFRGSSYGVDVGPYLSCFMLMGNGDVKEGQITYGNQTINQRVREAKTQDYMIKQDDWLNVQNGADTRKNQTLFNGSNVRFIHTPRDLATYVHDDALYQAYLNAALILLGTREPLFDPAFDQYWDGPETTGFALWGGPHILSLVTEVATRALKAVRWQKFNVHLRLRPETLAGRVVHARSHGTDFVNFKKALGRRLLSAVRDHNVKMGGEDKPWLPMAFQEGSPMHPTYGAGHATVAGACVTVLKSFFNTTAELRDYNGAVGFRVDRRGTPVEIVSVDNGEKLDVRPTKTPLTLLGELNKLAANISIGRNMAGVHYFSDYFDSVRMGERIAEGIMRDQADGYLEDFEMTYVPFDERPNRFHSNVSIVRDTPDQTS